MTSTVLVTGASGFVGHHLCSRLVESGFAVRAVVRSKGRADALPPAARAIVVPDITGQIDWSRTLEGTDVVVHLAARVHGVGDSDPDAQQSYRQVNTEATLSLAGQAAAAGVHRFVFISTIKVNGERTSREPFRPEDPPAPHGGYAQSKYEAEMQLFSLQEDEGLDVVVVRPPLVYGPGVHANFLKLLQLVESGMPLPLASVRNRRSFLGVWNLVDLLMQVLNDGRVSGKVLLVSDGEDVSTPQLLRLIADAMNRRLRLFGCPPTLLANFAAMIGRAEELRRLTDCLQVDISSTQRALGWSPPVSLQAGIEHTVRWYLQGRLRHG